MEEHRRRYYLDKIGIQTWVTRTASPESPSAGLTGEGVPLHAEHDEPADTAPVKDFRGSLDELRNEVASCTLCALHQGRTQTVFGTGSPDADWLIVGEAPGFEEDRKGEPFVGRAGQLLTKMLRAIGLERDEVFIANILKCRPPGNRDPQPGEIEHCMPYLAQQIGLIQPKIILAMGRIAAQTLLDSPSALGRLRGTEHHYADTGIPVVATYHPAYLLRSPQQKRSAWEDLQFAVRVRESSS